VAMEKEEKQAVMAAETDARRRLVIGVGFLVQGFQLFPWLGVNFFLKDGEDGMGVAASSLQILQASANLPMVAKPLLSLLSDAVPIRGHRHLPYVAICGTPHSTGLFLCSLVLFLHFLSRSRNLASLISSRNKQHLLLPFALSFYTRVLFPLVCPIGKRRHRK
jgi:hypothetical protein